MATIGHKAGRKYLPADISLTSSMQLPSEKHEAE